MTVTVHVGDARDVLRGMPDSSVHMCVTSPPYWALRAYHGNPGMIGMEPTFDEHLENLVSVFEEVRRVLRPDGTLWLNYGSAYASAPSSRAGAPHGAQSGKGDKARRGLWDRDFLSQNLCDGCAAALLSRRSPDSDARHVPECPAEAESTTPARMASDTARAANSGCPPSGERSAGQSPGSSRCEGQSAVASHGAPASNTRQSSPPLPGACSEQPIREASACPPAPDSWPPDVRPSVCKGCGRGIPGTSPRLPASDSRNGNDLSSSAWGNYTIAPHKPKDLMNMPFFVAEALRADGWYLRSEIIWHKPNPMPESATDRPTCAHEKVFLFSKAPRYFYDAEAVRVPVTGNAHSRGTTHDFGRDSGDRKPSAPFDTWEGSTANLRNVWKIAIAPYSEAHFATFPPALVEPCIKAGTSKHGVCSECGAPWKREVEKEFQQYGEGRSHINNGEYGNGWEGTPRGKNRTTTTGWLPTCECVHRWCDECATVLDCVQDVGIRDGCIHGEKAEPEHTGVRLRGVREAVHARQDQNPQGRALFQDVRGEIQRTEQVNDEGLDDHDHGIPDAASEGPSECDEVRVCDGAQAGGGGVSRQTPDPRRSGASHERQQAGQSDREPATDDEAGARRLQEADVLRDVPVLQPRLPGAGECPHCGRGARWKIPDTKPSVVLDCFGGAGTVGLVADRLQRDAVLIEISGDYAGMARKRIEKDAGMFASIASRMTAKGKD